MLPAVDGLDHAADFLFVHLGKAWNRENFLCQPFGFRQLTGMGRIIGRLPMVRYRIVNVGSDLMRFQMPPQAVAIPATNDKEMGYVIGAEILRAFDPRMPDLV